MRREDVPGVLGVDLAPGLEESTTPYAGVSLLIELMRRCGVDTVSNRVLAAKKGLSAGQMVECFVVLSALGGECLEDFAILRRDLGLEALLGYRPAAVETARQYLDRFHDEKLLEGRPEQGAFVPMEPSGLAGLGVVNEQVIRNYVGVMAPGREVTLDVDAHLVPTTKQEALVCYEGYPAYQPLLVDWAKTHLVLADAFRDGNVLAGHGIKELVDRAYGCAGREGVTGEGAIRLRGLPVGCAGALERAWLAVCRQRRYLTRAGAASRPEGRASSCGRRSASWHPGIGIAGRGRPAGR